MNEPIKISQKEADRLQRAARKEGKYIVLGFSPNDNLCTVIYNGDELGTPVISQSDDGEWLIESVMSDLEKKKGEEEE